MLSALNIRVEKVKEEGLVKCRSIIHQSERDRMTDADL